MKKIIAILLFIIVLGMTMVIATNGSSKLRRGDEVLKESLTKWEEVGNTSVFEVFGEFFKKGSPTLSQADKTRLIINLLIFSCIANVGISIYILSKDKKEIDTVVNTSKEFEKTSNNVAMLKNIKQVDNEFSKSRFIKNVKNKLILLEKSRNEKDMEMIKTLGTKDFANEQGKDLEDNAEKGLIEKTDKLKIKNVEIVRFAEGKVYDTIVVVAKIKKIQYWTNLEEDKVLKGNKISPVKAYYKISFVRSKNIYNNKEGICICPNCGAKINDKKQIRCEYCGCDVLLDWTLNSMKQL